MHQHTQPPFKKVMDLLLDTVCMVDAEGRFVYVSAACERTFGYKQNELIGRSIFGLVHPADKERTQKAAAAIMRGQPQTHFENRYIHKNGETVHIMWSALWSAEEGVRMAVARDITVLKQAEQQQNAVYQISEAVYTAQDLPELYRRIHRIIAELLPAPNFSVVLTEPKDRQLSFAYLSPGQPEAVMKKMLGDDSPVAQVIRNGKAMLTSIEHLRSEDDSQSTSWLGVPLRRGHRIMGAIIVHTSDSENSYTPKHKELLQFVSGQIATAIERKQTQTQLQHMANHDPLTGLPNRTLFYDRFDTALKRAQRYHQRLLVLYIDLDDFKIVNDEFGHEAGDILLQEVAQRLTQCLRDSDSVARMGGDEFSLLLADIDQQESIDMIIDKIRAIVGEPLQLNGHHHQISLSIGIALYPENGKSRTELIRYADNNMYQTKRQGIS